MDWLRQENELDHKTHFDVAGLIYVANVEDILDVLEKGQRLVLCREPKNKFDEYAILVQNEKKQKIGYMPRRMNHIPGKRTSS